MKCYMENLFYFIIITGRWDSVEDMYITDAVVDMKCSHHEVIGSGARQYEAGLRSRTMQCLWQCRSYV